MKDLVAGNTFKRPSADSSASRTSAATPIGSATTWRWPTSTASAGWPGIPTSTAKQIADEWTRLTFGRDPQVVGTIVDMLLKSWSIYENYTGPLGVGTLTDIIHVHYGPGIESSENNGWGQWHRADDKGIGMDRTVATGTGFIGQYSPARRPRVRIARNLPRRAAAVHAPRAVHHVLKSGKT